MVIWLLSREFHYFLYKLPQITQLIFRMTLRKLNVGESLLKMFISQ